MNWLKMLVYLCFIFYFAYHLGTRINSYLKWKKKTYAAHLLSGFLALIFIQWCIGFPCQLFHVHWNTYFYLLLVVYASLFMALIWKKPFRFPVKELLQHYWFLFLVVACLAFWSMSSQLPYLLMNYDDHYYLGAIVRNIGADALASVNYFNGTPMDLGISRLINTYEIGYGFWSSLFHIDPTFFARAVMVIQNYYIICIALCVCIEQLCDMAAHKVQYITVVLLPFMIPAGYLEQNFYIRLYDEWQFNTAIWYGGSLVRTISLPVCFVLIKHLIDDFRVPKLLFLFAVFAAFISLSSIFIAFAIVACMMGYLYFAWMMVEKKGKKGNIIAGVMVIVMIAGMKIGPKCLELLVPKLTNFYLNMAANISNQFAYYTANFIMIIVSFVIMLLYYRKGKQKRIAMIALIAGFICMLIYSGMFYKAILTICFGYDFVVYRLLTGIQIFLLILFGCCLLAWLDQVVKYPHGIMACAVASLILVNTVNLIHVEDYEYDRYAGLSTAMSIYGYMPDRMFQNEYMAPNVFHDVNEYFSTLEKGTYRIISPHMVHYEDGNLFLSVGLAFASQRVESCMSYENVRCDNIDFGSVQKFVDFSDGRIAYEDVSDLLEEYDIRFVLTPSEGVRDDLAQRGYECVMDSVSLANDHLYLIRLY